mgnify:CR=1 FL=1
MDPGRGETVASMSVLSVGPGDSGMYSCVPPGSHPATVHVHVQKGREKLFSVPAFMIPTMTNIF